MMKLPALALCLALPLFAAEPKSIPLWPDGAPEAKGKTPDDIPTLTVFLPTAAQAVGTGIVICPGGGYGHLAMDHEGYDVAKWLNGKGVAAFVLRYRLPAKGYRHPIPLLDAQRALRLVRSKASEWQIKTDRVGTIGFSAGGHLASTVGTHFDPGQPNAADPVDRLSCRPDFLVLGYPVITFASAFTHRGSKNNLLGPKPDPKLVASLSNETQITKDTPPTFLFHAHDDRGVSPRNSIEFYLGLLRAKVPAEMHIYAKGGHGFGIGRKGTQAAETWQDRFADWLQRRGLLSKPQ
ncbi:MAG: alpha/beta hydrolase [Victivallales bacterium]|nr:alpha/beta hydrolase [Victivallales bacterium]